MQLKRINDIFQPKIMGETSQVNATRFIFQMLKQNGIRRAFKRGKGQEIKIVGGNWMS